MTNRLSVIVHTEKEASHLARCLGAVVAQRLTTRSLEIIVVDHRGRLAVRHLVNWWNSSLQGRASETRVSYVASRSDRETTESYALKLCSGEIVAHVDETECPDRDWAARGIASVLERSSSPSLNLFDGYQQFQWKHDLLVARQSMSSQIAVSQSFPSFSLARNTPLRLTSGQGSHAIRAQRLLPSIRICSAVFVLLSAFAVTLADWRIGMTSGVVALVGFTTVSLLRSRRGPKPVRDESRLIRSVRDLASLAR